MLSNTLLYSPPPKGLSYMKSKLNYSPTFLFSPQQAKSPPLDIDYSQLSNKSSLESLIAIANRLNSPSPHSSGEKNKKEKNEKVRQPSDFCLDNDISPKSSNENENQPIVQEPNFIRNNRKPGVSITTKVPSPLKIIQTLNGIESTKNNQHLNNKDDGYLPSVSVLEKVYYGTKYSIKNKFSKNVIEFSYKEDQNIYYKESMEDKGKSIDNFNSNPHNLLLTLFDGHGGDSVSNYLQANYNKFFKKRLTETNGNVVNSLHTSFQQIDKALKTLDFVRVGSTGCVVYITQEGNKKVLYCANAGDTRCTLFYPNKYERISYDHRADDPKEKQRIVNNGGIVINKRVMGQLMLSRAFGDFELKTFGVKCEPYIIRKEININEKNQFLIIASDGIWDVLSEKDIQDYINLICTDCALAEDKIVTLGICDKLLQVALARGSWDNLSIFSVKLS